MSESSQTPSDGSASPSPTPQAVVPYISREFSTPPTSLVDEIARDYGFLKPDRRNHKKTLARVWTAATAMAAQNLVAAMVRRTKEPDPLVALLVVVETTAAQAGLSTTTLLGEMLRAATQMEQERNALTLVHPPEEPNGQG